MSMTNFESIGKIDSARMLGYLIKNKWQQSSQQELFSVWTKGSFEVVVPDKKARDYNTRLVEALREISAQSNQSISNILTQILLNGFNTIKISSVGLGSESGTVSFDDGAKLIGNIRDLLIASANATIEPRRVFSGRRTAATEAFLKDSRLGQTERGSFVFTVLAPIMVEESSDCLDIDPPSPFGLRVLETMLNATELASETALALSNDPSLFRQKFEPLVSRGVSANLCTALSNLLDLEGAEKMIISVVPGAETNFKRTRIEVPASLSSFFAHAAQEFRKDPPLNNVFIEGKTISFKRQAYGNAGIVAVKGNVGGESRRIVFELPPKDYNLVLDAHKHDRPISFFANLRKTKQSYEAVNLRELSLSRQGEFFK